MGSAEFTRALGRLDRGRRPGRAPAYNGNGGGNGYATTVPQRVDDYVAVAVVPDTAVVRSIPLVSPLRGGEVSGTIEVRIGAPARAALADAPVSAADDEPPFPDEVMAAVVAAQNEPTAPVEAAPDQALHIQFARGAQEQVVQAFGALREIIHGRPGPTRVVLHVPTQDGRMQRMDLRVGVAYDAELLTMIERRLGPRSVELRLAS